LVTTTVHFFQSKPIFSYLRDAGHPHHLSNTYEWRLKRGEEEFGYDGFDMMSGGNGYDISHLTVASKLFFNWMTNDAVILMQPEGSTVHCPLCLSSISKIVLKPFDDKNVYLSLENKMAVHIPSTASINA
jgi:hypothetical protein